MEFPSAANLLYDMSIQVLPHLLRNRVKVAKKFEKRGLMN